MFEWDKDVDELVTAETRPPEPEPDSRDRANRIRRRLVPGLCVGALAALGLAMQAGVMPWKSAPDLMSAGFLPFHVAAADSADVTLQVLDRQQANRFQSGLRSFSDADLQQYSRTARQDMVQASAFMRPSHADAVALIDLEMQRRGL